VQRAKKKYYNWLKMEKRCSLMIGLAFLALGLFLAFLNGLTSWPALLFFAFAAILLVFCLAKTFESRKKGKSRLP
jgi:membrane protein implicated in regulation of membrane protease activity